MDFKFIFPSKGSQLMNLLFAGILSKQGILWFAVSWFSTETPNHRLFGKAPGPQRPDISHMRAGRLVKSRNRCSGLSSIILNTSLTTLFVMLSWNKSPIEQTKTILGFF